MLYYIVYITKKCKNHKKCKKYRKKNENNCYIFNLKNIIIIKIIFIYLNNKIN